MNKCTRESIIPIVIVIILANVVVHFMVSTRVKFAIRIGRFRARAIICISRVHFEGGAMEVRVMCRFCLGCADGDVGIGLDCFFGEVVRKGVFIGG